VFTDPNWICNTDNNDRVSMVTAIVIQQLSGQSVFAGRCYAAASKFRWYSVLNCNGNSEKYSLKPLSETEFQNILQQVTGPITVLRHPFPILHIGNVYNSLNMTIVVFVTKWVVSIRDRSLRVPCPCDSWHCAN
jgi:hypothetical protein